jgi:hypothetical protein
MLKAKSFKYLVLLLTDFGFQGFRPSALAFSLHVLLKRKLKIINVLVILQIFFFVIGFYR